MNKLETFLKLATMFSDEPQISSQESFLEINKVYALEV